MWVIAGLGNPGEEYTGSRHNVGREFLRTFEKKLPKKVTVAYPDTYMNNSGGPIRKLVPNKKAAAQLIVLHDDLDLPLGSVKISFGAGSGGHRGVESVIKALNTRNFVRVRVGISPSTPGGRLKKPKGEEVVAFVLGPFKKSEQEKLKKAKKVVAEALGLILSEGLSFAMTEINAR